MATYTIVKLKNITPTHIGTGKEHYDFSSADLHSDTISAALASMLAQKGRSDEIETFLNSFSISSAFPYFKNLYFLPNIQGKLNVVVDDKSELEVRKKLKKVKYIELSLWQQLAGSSVVKIKENQIIKQYLLDDSLNFEEPFKSNVSQRVSVNREDDQDPDPFYFNWTYYQKESGLYFIVDAQGDLLNEIIELFELLGESGIGTDRNIGGGRFDVETSTITITPPQDSNASVILSLFVPTQDEMNCLDIRNAKYSLVLRGGYIAGSSEEDLRHLRKKSIYMFGVGSVFLTTSSLAGKVVNLAPDWNDSKMHPVYRSGKPFYLPVKLDCL